MAKAKKTPAKVPSNPAKSHEKKGSKTITKGGLSNLAGRSAMKVRKP